MINIEAIDHIVLTVNCISVTSRFYAQVLGMKALRFGTDRHALAFGHQKINLHEVDRALQPCAQQPTPGSADLCLITTTPIKTVMRHLQDCGVAILLGPVKRTGARGEIISVYFRDPDLNLIEVSRYDNALN